MTSLLCVVAVAGTLLFVSSATSAAQSVGGVREVPNVPRPPGLAGAPATAAASVTATVIERDIPCRSGKPFCSRDRPPTANQQPTAGEPTFAAYLAERSNAPVLGWSASWATGASGPSPQLAATANGTRARVRVGGDSVYTVFLYY